MANVSYSSQREDNKEELTFAFPRLFAAVSVSFCTALWDKCLRNQAFVLQTNIWLCSTNPVLISCQKTFGTNWFVEYLNYFYCYSTSKHCLHPYALADSHILLPCSLSSHLIACGSGQWTRCQSQTPHGTFKFMFTKYERTTLKLLRECVYSGICTQLVSFEQLLAFGH